MSPPCALAFAFAFFRLFFFAFFPSFFRARSRRTLLKRVLPIRFSFFAT